MSRPDTMRLELPLQEFTCPITLEIPVNPVSSSCCGALFEYTVVTTLRSCPCCRSTTTAFAQAAPVIQQILEQVRSTLIAREEDAGARPLPIDFPVALIHSIMELEDKPRIVRNMINDVIRLQYPEVYDRWFKQEEARNARLTIEAETQQTFKALLSLARQQGLFRTTITAEYQYTALEAVNDILQQVVYGQRAKVREMLDKIKRENPALLKTVLTSVATTPITDYSGKKIEHMTLLQAALAANDVAIHADLAARDPDHQGMCEIISSYFDESFDDQADISAQYAAVLKRCLQQNYPREQVTPAQENDPHALHEIYRRAQEQNTFDLSKIVAAVTKAGTHAPLQITAALNKEGASFTESDVAPESDVARAKPDDQLTLTESFNRFREQYEKHALSKIAVNPYDLLKAFQIYDEQFERWNWDQRNLFVRQVIGFAQRYLSAADARVFAFELYSALEGKHKVPDHFNFRYEPSYHFYPLAVDRSCVGLGFDYCAWAGVGRPFGGGWYGGACSVESLSLETYVEQKQLPVRSYAASSRAVTRPV